MQSSQARYSKSFFFSILLHGMALFALIVSFDFNSAMPVLENSAKNTEIINARVVNTLPLPLKISPLPDKPLVTPAAVKPLLLQPAKEKSIAILNKKQKQQQNKIAEQLLSDIKKETNQRKKITKQKAIAAAFEKEMKQLSARSLQQQTQQEKKHLSGARVQEVRGEVNKYKALILQTISQNWLIPKTVDKSLRTELLIRVAPGGMILTVEILKSSGDDILDRSARTAVLKSSPLPVPSDPDAFEIFRQFVLKVKPENILNSSSWES
ncbi:MAG: TolA colicin import membrane protein [uncultured bacterium]|nr:MAG: TolA colicin import membrane protein [uncultured bacterium]